MTIVSFLKDSTFGPPHIHAISAALEDVCKILSVADHTKNEKELLAKKGSSLSRFRASAAPLRCVAAR